MHSSLDISVKQLRRAVIIKERIARLESQLGQILDLARPSVARVTRRRGRRGNLTAVSAPSHRRGRRRIKRSAAWRAKLSAAARARWKKVKAAGRKRL